MANGKNSALKMGEMPIPKLVIRMAAPAIVSMLVQALYNIVDSIFVSGYSEAAFSAISLAFPIQIVIIAIAVGLGVGINSMVSRKLGEKDVHGASNSAEHGIMMFLVLSVVLLFVGMFASKYFFRLFSTDEILIEYGTIYISIIMMFSFGRMITQGFVGIFQGSGNMIVPMISQILGAVINMILDPILIYGTVFDIRFCEAMGVKGAAIATIIGQISSMIFVIIVFFSREHAVSLKLREFKFSKKILGGILSVGLPTAVSQGIMSVMVGGLNAILSGVSIAAITAVGAYFKINSFVFMPIFGFAAGVMPIAGYNFGAKNKKRYKQAVRVGATYALAIATVGAILFLVIPERLLGIFSLSDEVVRIGKIAFRVLGATFPIISISIMLAASMQAIGKATISMMSNLMRGIFILLPLAYIFLTYIGLDYIWYAAPIGEIASIIFLSLNFRKVLRNWDKPMEV